MAICDGCGNNMLIPNKVLGHTLCLKCAKTLKANTWKNKDFETNEAVISMKSDVIFSASRAGISGNVIQTVSDYFDAQIEEGLVYKFDGGEDQILKVYEDYCQIITLEDLLEEVVGDIWDEMDEVEEETQKESEGVYLIDGDMNIDDFFEFIKFDDDEYECSYTTVSGWCTEMLDKFPKENDTFEFAGYKVTILEVDGVRAEKIKLEEIKKESE